jgi:hypothetical protein
MKNLIIAVGLTLLIGAGFYYFNFSKVSHHQEEPEMHSHDGDDPHAH